MGKTQLLAAALGLALIGTAALAQEAETERDGIAIRSLDSDDFSDLEGLRELIGDARIVQLGESSHGVEEYSQIKSRLIRFLHEEMDFDVLVFESSLYECTRAGGMIGEESRDRVLTGCIFGVWHTETLRGLFDYIIETHDTPDPLTLTGYDIQSNSWNWRGRPDFLHDVVATLDADYAARVRDGDAAFLAPLLEGDAEAWQANMRENRDGYIAFYSDLQAWLSMNEDLLAAAHSDAAMPYAPLIARQTAFSIAHYIRRATSDSPQARLEYRDWGMAVNMRALAEDIFPDSRIIVWAHNTHIRHNNQDVVSDSPHVWVGRSTGHWLHDWYGDEIFTLGLYARSGEMATNRRRALPVLPPEPGQLESVTIPEGAVGLIFAPQGDDDPLWHEWGSARLGGLFDVGMIPADQYDAVLLLEAVSAPDYIDWNE